ncbi:MAG: NAD(P)H-binding protein [Candidatus Saccharibacteria bacterium]
MTITVLGASGKIGQLLVKELLSKNYKLKVFVHLSNPFAESKNLKIIKGDINIATDIDRAIMGSDLVISTLGSWGTKSKDILTSAMENIIPSMMNQKVQRIISLTGADARMDKDKETMISSISHIIFSILAGKILVDGERHIKLLEGSNLDWTVIRSPRMTNSSAENGYKLNKIYPMPWESIPRQCVVNAIISQIEDRSFISESPFIHSN